MVVCSSSGPKILAFGSHCSANFQPILDCFIPNFKLTYEDSENIKADRVSTGVFFGGDTRYMANRPRLALSPNFVSFFNVHEVPKINPWPVTQRLQSLYGKFQHA